MNGFDRVHAAMNGRWPDTVPIMLHNFMPAAREAGYSQREFCNDPRKAADAFIRMTEKYDLDGVVMDFNTATIAGALGVTVTFSENEPARCSKGVLKSLKEVDDLKDADISNDKYIRIWLDTMRLLREHFGNEKYLRGNVDQAPFSIAGMMRTQTEWLIDLTDKENHEMAIRLLEYCTRASCRFVQLMTDAGAHMVSSGDSPAGPDMISPAMYRKFALPFEDEVAAYAHGCGVPYLLHICGNTDAILDGFANRPVDAVELDYKTDIRRIHDLVLISNVTFWGNVDPSDVFALGTPDEVRKEKQKLVELFSDTPRFILCSGCALPSLTPGQNIRAFCER